MLAFLVNFTGNGENTPDFCLAESSDHHSSLFNNSGSTEHRKTPGPLPQEGYVLS